MEEAVMAMACLPSGEGPGLVRERGQPLYVTLARQLQEGLRSGRWAQGKGVPSERVLSSAMAVSRCTARRALNLLRERGMVKRMQGSGTYAMAGPPAPRDAAAGAQQWLRCERAAADAQEMLSLGLAPESEVMRICSLLLGAERRPLLLQSSSLPLCHLPRPLAWQEDLEAYLAAQGWTQTRMLQRVRAVNASPEQARLLGVPVGSALLHLQQVRYARDGQALELSHSYRAGGDTGYSVELRA